MGELLARKLRKAVYEKLLRFQMGFFDRHENTPGSILTKLSNDTQKVNGIAMSILGISVQTAVNLIIGLALGFANDYRLTLINLGFLPFVVGETYLRLRLQKGFLQSDEIIETEAGAILSESVINTKSIFSYNMESKVVHMYREILSAKDSSELKSSIIGGILYGFSQFLIFCVYATMFYAGGQFISDKSQDLDRVRMMRALFCLLFAAFGVGQAQQYVQDYAGSRTAVINLYKTLDEESKIDPYKNHIEEKEVIIEGKVEFKAVSFSYPSRPEEKVLKDINFEIKQGQKAAFVGFSGSGKSSIIQLVERFYDSDEGEVLIDGKNIKDYDLINLRKAMGFVMQEPVLFKDTVVNNIKYGSLKAVDSQIVEAAKNAMIEKYVTGEQFAHDANVSGGEKQRIAIARAIIKKPRILLLDEATSALDKTTEVLVQKNLDEVLPNTTFLVVAHKYFSYKV
jgi:ATP-binding cassette subfamily B (MDR/TAP) protein 1